MIDWTRPVKTVIGCEIRVFCTYAKDTAGYVVCGTVKVSDEFEDITRWKLDGTPIDVPSYKAIQAPTTYYAGVYRDERGIPYVGGVFTNPSHVRQAEDYIKTITFEV